MSTYTAEVVIKESGADHAAAKIHAVGDAATHAHGPMEGLRHGADLLREAFLVLGLSMSLEKIVEMADSYLILQKRLAQVSDSAQQQSEVWQRLNQIAQEHSQDIGALTGVYVGLKRQGDQYRISAEQILGVVNSMGALLQAQGRSADDVAGAMKRLAAGMAQGSISGRTMLTLFTQFPELMAGISQASGRSQQAIKILAENGSISMKQLMEWMTRAKDGIKEVPHHVDEVGDAMVRLRNAMTNAVGELDKVGAGSAMLSKFLDNAAITAIVLAKGIGILILAFGHLAEWVGRANTIIDEHLGWLKKILNIAVPVAGAVEFLTKSFSKLKAENDALAKAEHGTHGAMQQVATAGGTVARQIGAMSNAHGQAAQAASQHGSQVHGLSGALQENGTQLKAVGATHEQVAGQITVTRGAVDGFTKSVYENGAALNDTPVQLQRTRSSIDELGNSTKTVTQSLRDVDGTVIAMKKTIDTFRDGIHTSSQYTIDLAGNIKLVSQSVEDATVRLDRNSQALAKNAMALAAVGEGAERAAASYNHMATASSHTSGGGGGSSGGYQGVGSASFGTSDRDIEFMRQTYAQTNSIIGWGSGRGPITDPTWWTNNFNDNGTYRGGASTQLPGGGSSLAHFAYGGSFDVQGKGGTDNNLVAFMASRGEKVRVETPEQQRNGNGRGGDTIHVAMAVHGVKDPEGFRKSQPQIMTQLSDQIYRAQTQLRRSSR